MRYNPKTVSLCYVNKDIYDWVTKHDSQLSVLIKEQIIQLWKKNIYTLHLMD